jgi:hypothetical protein
MDFHEAFCASTIPPPPPPYEKHGTPYGVLFIRHCENPFVGLPLFENGNWRLLTRGVSHTVALPFTLKSVLRQKKKNYGNSNIYTMPKYNLPKNPSKIKIKIID